MDWLTAIAAWFDAHPAGTAWWLAWLASLGAAQAVKSIFLPVWWTTEQAGRVTQLVSICTGSAVAFVLLSAVPHRVILALVVGMSAPVAYSFGTGLLRAFVPKLADQLSWAAVKDRKARIHRPKK